MKKISFGIRNLPIQKGFVKYLETRQIDEMTLDRNLDMFSAANNLKKVRVRDIVLQIVRENQDDDLLLIDDDVYLGMDFDFSRERDFIYIAFPHGPSDRMTLQTAGTCFFLPKRLSEQFQDTILMYNNPKWDFDPFLANHLPFKQRLILLNGTRHIWSSERIMMLEVYVAGGAVMVNRDDMRDNWDRERGGWWDIKEILPFENPVTHEKVLPVV